MKKKVLAILLLIPVLSLAACSIGTSSNTPVSDPQVEEVQDVSDPSALSDPSTLSDSSTREDGILGSPHIAIEATVVDGIVHAAYVSYDEYPEWVSEWISGIVQAAERDDLEEVTAILAENTDKALEIKLDHHFYINGYKVYWMTGFIDDNVTPAKDIFIIPENEGMGYHVVLVDDKLEVYEYCQCADGMYNGDSVRYVSKSDTYVYGHIINGLYDGEKITIKADGTQEVSTWTNGIEISPVYCINDYRYLGGGRSFSGSELSESPLEVYPY